MTASRELPNVSLMAALLFSTCFGSKKGYENWSSSVPAGRFKTVATIAGGDGRNDLRMSVQVRNDLQKAGVNALKVSGRWENITQAISQVCSPSAAQPVDGIVVVKYDYVVLYDCRTSKAAFEMQGSSEAGLTDITKHLIKYLKRPAPIQANQPPLAAFTSSCTALSCSFTSTSSDPDGSIAAYSWNFGDGATSTPQNPSHAYGAGGSYDVSLTVTDNQGATGSTSHTVTVNNP